MILAVFDCNVIISGIGWGGNPRSCLNLFAARQVTLCITPEIWMEYDQRVPEVLAEKKPGVDARPMLDFILRTARMVEPAPLGKQRSRDLTDDRYLACALSAGATLIVTIDRDLLDLEKPFGVQMVTPVEFILHVRNQTGQ